MRHVAMHQTSAWFCLQTADLDEEAADTLDLETIELINLVRAAVAVSCQHHRLHLPCDAWDPIQWPAAWIAMLLVCQTDICSYSMALLAVRVQYSPAPVTPGASAGALSAN